MKFVNFNKRRNSRNKIEKVLYEMRPYSLLIIALYSITFPTHSVMTVAGAVLVLCSGLIFSMRLRARGII